MDDRFLGWMLRSSQREEVKEGKERKGKCNSGGKGNGNQPVSTSLLDGDYIFFVNGGECLYEPLNVPL